MEGIVVNTIDSDDLLNRANSQLENGFSIAASVAQEMISETEFESAAKAVLRYNTGNTKILELFPKFLEFVDPIKGIIEDYMKLSEAGTLTGEQFITLGHCYLVTGDFPNSFSAYVIAQRASNEISDPYFWYGLGIVHHHYKYREHAISCFNKIINLDDSFVFSQDLQFRYAILLRTLLKYDESLEYFHKVLPNPPNNLLEADILLQIGYTYEKMRKTESAFIIYKDIYSRFPKSKAAMHQYLWFVFLNNCGIALEEITKLVENILMNDPANPELMLLLARIALRNKDLEKAYQYYRSCLSFYNDNPYFWCALGTLYYQNGQIPDSLMSYQRALYYKKDIEEPWLNIGLIYESQNDLQNASKMYDNGRRNCINSSSLTTRYAYIAAQRTFSSNYPIADVDDAIFFENYAEKFSNQYVAAVPSLPKACLGLKDTERVDDLSTFPKSLFD